MLPWKYRPDPELSSKYKLFIYSLISDLQVGSRNVSCSRERSNGICYFCQQRTNDRMITIIENDFRSTPKGINKINVHIECCVSLMQGSSLKDLTSTAKIG